MIESFEGMDLSSVKDSVDILIYSYLYFSLLNELILYKVRPIRTNVRNIIRNELCD